MVYFVIAMYALFVVLANLTANTIITFGIQFALGTVFFGFVFTARDMLHTLVGKTHTYYTIIGVTVLNLGISLMGAFDIRILIASIIAFVVAESIDTEVFHRFFKDNYTKRVLASNMISIPVDTVLFTLVAFYGIWPMSLILSVIFGDMIIKFVTSAALIKLKV
jgi:queuosine precursor transporter